MKTKEIKKLTQDQLFSELEKLKKEQFNTGTVCHL